MRTLCAAFVAVMAFSVACSSVLAVPLEASSAEVSKDSEVVANTTQVASEPQPPSTTKPEADRNPDKESEAQDLDTAASEDKEQTFTGTVGGGGGGGVAATDNMETSASNFDPTAVYAGFLTPDAFQQYMNQFGGAYAPYAGAAYPAPVGYVPPPPPPGAYPSPYVVQTGYEGYLVPSTIAGGGTAPDGGVSNTETTNSIVSMLNPITVLTNIFPALMMSTLFKVFAAIVSTIGMIFFGGAITTAICNFTPLCDISFKAVAYLKHRGAGERVGHMLVEEMTPERLRRATEFVRGAMRKYRQLQKLIDDQSE